MYGYSVLLQIGCFVMVNPNDQANALGARIRHALSLVDLNLGNNRLGKEGLDALCSALNYRRESLKILSLQNNCLTDECCDRLVNILFYAVLEI